MQDLSSAEYAFVEAEAWNYAGALAQARGAHDLAEAHWKKSADSRLWRAYSLLAAGSRTGRVRSSTTPRASNGLSTTV